MMMNPFMMIFDRHSKKLGQLMTHFPQQNSDKNTNQEGDFAEYTPMMRQYMQVKHQYPNALLFYRMGDFYELFFEDAKQAAKILGITLTQRGKVNNEPIPMAGVPYHAAEGYLAKLVKAGCQVAICEQVGEGESAGVRGKAPMDRQVVRVLTAGTLTEDALLSREQNHYLLAIVLHKQQLGMAILDLSTGQFKAQQGILDLAQLSLDLARIRPKEIIVSESLKQHALIDSIQSQHTTQSPYSVTFRPEADFNANNAHTTLCKQFSVSTLAGFGLEPYPLAQIAAAALIYYAQATQKSALPHLTSIHLEQTERYIALDHTTRRNLEILEPLFEHGTSLFQLVNNCQTAMGSRLLAQHLTQPIREQQLLEQRLDTLDILLAGCHEQALGLILKQIGDIERILTRIALKTARPRDLLQLRLACGQLPLLQHAIEPILLCKRVEDKDKYHHLRQIAKTIGTFNPIYDYLNAAIIEQPPLLLRDGGVIAVGFDAELDELRQIRDHTGQFLLDLEQQERQKTGINTLKIGYNRVSGYYIELSKGQSDHAPSHFIRRQTLKNAERYITPELKSFEDKVLSSESRALAREKQLYEQILTELQQEIIPLQSMSRAIAELDVACNWASQVRQRQWVRPTFSDTMQIEIQAGRHPVVEALNKNPYTANATTMNAQQHLHLITGPNMGGKSTYMRQIALIVLLAHCGSFVPAQAACVSHVDRIFTRIGSADDLSTGKSTFMVEMTETAQILHYATAQSLVIMDEVGRGTSTYDGLSLAWACVLELAERVQCLTLFATHYFELTELARQDGIANIHVVAKDIDGQLLLLHKVESGAASRSFGLQVAKRAGIPIRVIQMAKQKLKQLEQYPISHQSIQPDLLTLPQIEYIEIEQPSKIEQQLIQLDVDEFSPKQALAYLYQLKQQILDKTKH